ncbi:MAG: PspC domain-containing protein [Legionellaceae bacterium]|nr:PspC domain-containing protein [Legionellaceae bacterium]
MKKVNLLEHTYICSDKAAAQLKEYIQKIHIKFTTEPDVVRDIELGMIAKLDHILSTKTKEIIYLVDVELLVQHMNDYHLNDCNFDQEKLTSRRKNLYRDCDNQIVAGVCGGVAAHFNASIWLVRFIFIFLFFTPVPVVIPYLLMWYLIPPAFTEYEKMHMRGIPVNDDATINNSKYIRNRAINLAKLIAICLGVVAFTFLIVAIISKFLF